MTLAPFSRDHFPGLAPGEDTVMGPEQLDETLGSLGARRLGLVPADRPADVLPLLGWTPSDQSSALPSCGPGKIVLVRDCWRLDSPRSGCWCSARRAASRLPSKLPPSTGPSPTNATTSAKQASVTSPPLC